LQVLAAKKEIIKKLVKVVGLYCAPGIKPKHINGRSYRWI